MFSTLKRPATTYLPLYIYCLYYQRDFTLRVLAAVHFSLRRLVLTEHKMLLSILNLLNGLGGGKTQ
jgi:hypothetical protein